MLNNLNITTNGGTFDFTHFDKVVVNNNKVVLDSKKANYIFNDLIVCQEITYENFDIVDGLVAMVTRLLDN